MMQNHITPTTKRTSGKTTVELLITDPPRGGHPLYIEQLLWNRLNLPYLLHYDPRTTSQFTITDGLFGPDQTS